MPSSVKKDYYKILGVPPIATFDEIKRAYRQASKKYHPDLNPDLKLFSEEKMRELVEAYETISDPEKRKEYDRQPHFQLRKGRKKASQLDPKSFTKGGFKKEPSMLERLFSPFLKKGTSPTGERIDPKNADVRFTLGLTMAEKEQFYDQAIAEFKLAVKYDPTYLEAYWNLGILCYRKGLFDEAIVNFQKVLSLNKDDPHAKKMIELLRDDA
jgi:DnaJ-class molecular chaperone